MTDCECDCCQHWKAERADMRAELAAERERLAKLQWKLEQTEGNRDAHMAAGNDMAELIAKLEAENARLRSQLRGKTFPLDQDLNEGDGTYRREGSR